MQYSILASLADACTNGSHIMDVLFLASSFVTTTRSKTRSEYWVLFINPESQVIRISETVLYNACSCLGNCAVLTF